MKKILLTVVVLVVVLISWMLLKNKADVALETPTYTVSSTSDSTFLTGSGQANSPQAMQTSLVSPKPKVSPSLVILKNIIIYTNLGYTPNTMTIKKGETITWKNESDLPMWTASAMHPGHKGYPGSGIEICDMDTSVANFDACKGYGLGDSWSFRFDNVGTWGYHNHSNSPHWGKIIVE